MEILKGKTLLIVDDEPDLREPIVTEFQSLGCEVFEASNGRLALELVKTRKIDAVISDIRMPGGDGIELLRKIKALHHSFPVVMLITGFSDLSREDVYDLGAEAILAKPFDLDEIDAAVVRVLTPKAELWGNVPADEKITRSIDQLFYNFDGGSEGVGFKLGRGGFFLQLASNHPFPNDIVSVRIRFSSGELLLIEGTGIVRWVRREGGPEGLPSGCGIEFESLSSQTRGKILEMIEILKPKAFIPKN